MRGDKKFRLIDGRAIIPGDTPELKELGVDEVFSSRSKIENIVKFIKEHV